MEAIMCYMGMVVRGGSLLRMELVKGKAEGT